MLGREGIAAKDENLLITDGCQQSLDLISKAFVRPGDSVILENPTYPGAAAIFGGTCSRRISRAPRAPPCRWRRAGNCWNWPRAIKSQLWKITFMRACTREKSGC